ncbi:MAG: thioredoxin [Candidatus Brocadiia bacterium]
MSQYITEVTDATFKTEVINSKLPVLVDFWAPWCGPCKMITPILEKLAPEYQSKVKIAKVNVDDSPETATDYGISAIPTLLLIKGGEIKEQVVGFQSEPQLKKLLDSVID